jgi:cobaltochelatase CobS
MTTTTAKIEEAAKKNLATPATGIKCELDGVYVHSVPIYLKTNHPEVSPADYQLQFPDAPMFSQALLDAQAKKQAGQVSQMAGQVIQLQPRTPAPPQKKSFAEVFGLGDAKAALNKKGDPIMIDVLGAADPETQVYIPEIDTRYVFNIDLLKTVMMGFQMNLPLLAWGKHGTGKTTVIEQYCARTNRPMIRVQHTIGTEEAHVLGQWIIRDGETVFQPGPLAYAMRYGLTYLADEYDFAIPAVISLYQPVLEGKALVIKDACPEWRMVHPHPNFRFAATGNTNGGGDETGLYQGTQIQNAANYSRFGITVEVMYMEEKLEAAVVASQGGLHVQDAEHLVKVATSVRTSFGVGDISCTISPRELINAARLGRALGGDWRQALALAFTNRLNTEDRQAVNELIGRIFPAS